MVGDVELIVHVAGNRKIKKVKIIVPGQKSLGVMAILSDRLFVRSLGYVLGMLVLK